MSFRSYRWLLDALGFAPGPAFRAPECRRNSGQHLATGVHPCGNCFLAALPPSLESASSLCTDASVTGLPSSWSIRMSLFFRISLCMPSTVSLVQGPTLHLLFCFLGGLSYKKEPQTRRRCREIDGLAPAQVKRAGRQGAHMDQVPFAYVPSDFVRKLGHKLLGNRDFFSRDRSIFPSSMEVP